MASGYPLVWDSSEDEQIKRGYESGEKIYAIAWRLKRRYSQIVGRAGALHLRHKNAVRVAAAPPSEPPATRPVDNAVARHLLHLFRTQSLDTLDLARLQNRGEAEVVRMLQAAREAERAAMTSS